MKANKVINVPQAPADTGASAKPRFLSEEIASRWAASWLNRASVLGVAIVLAAYLGIFLPAETVQAGPTFWLATWWARTTLIILVGVNTYILVQTLSRLLALVMAMNSYFSENEPNLVYVSHPDGAGGFGAIGQLTVRLGIFAVLIGVWAVWLSLLPVFVGGTPLFNAASIILYFAYVILAILIFALMLWPVHVAMRRYKYRLLEPIAINIQTTLVQMHPVESVGHKQSEQLQKGLQELSNLYDQIEQTPEWPISRALLKQFSSVSSLPGVVGLILSVYETLSELGSVV